MADIGGATSADTSSGIYNSGLIGSTPNPLRDQAATLLQDHRVQAFLGALRQGESGGQYNVVNGGRKFDGYSAHPNIPVPQPKGPPSTAAGAYQFTYPTWSEGAKNLGLQDFSPASQDLAAVNKLHELGAIDDLIKNDDLDGATVGAAKRWYSLPTDSNGKNRQGAMRSIDNFKNEYYKRLY